MRIKHLIFGAGALVAVLGWSSVGPAQAEWVHEGQAMKVNGHSGLGLASISRRKPGRIIRRSASVQRQSIFTQCTGLVSGYVSAS